ncbi:MAG: hypothetical protein OER04_16310, partial [Cyclobacteriaceae bacterium]|nr:hypothetical protein [Cyclobacteriaceae bacterium]
EGRPRKEDFDRALKAEVRDALWMLSKQWQMGEFIGDDAASPVLAKLQLATSKLTKYQAKNGDSIWMEPKLPLETKVEHQPIPFIMGQNNVSLDIRLLMGRQWLKMVTTLDLTYKAEYLQITRYEISSPQADQESDAFITAHVKVWQHFSAVAGRNMDGFKFYQYLKESASNNAYDDIPSADTLPKQNEIAAMADKFIVWFERQFYQPKETQNPSWQPSYLEHQFRCSAPKGSTEKVFIAEEYYHGHLDWYNLDIDPHTSDLEDPEGTSPEVEGNLVQSFIPTSVTFGGMPHRRWWTFEDWKTNLGFIKPDTTDLNKLMVLDFALIYANDWFMFPITMPVGTIADVKGLMVTNVFGENIWVEAAGKGSDEDWEKWGMFNLNIKGTEDVPTDLSLVLIPTVNKVLEGKPQEEVFMLRDEIANMVWGVESMVPLATGKSKSGKEVGHEFNSKLQKLKDKLAVPPPEIAYQADLRYQIINTVPEQWIPFIPVHLEGSNREIQLQRASMPRILENDPNPPQKIEARTSLLRHGLDEDPPKPYSIFEEEIPREGIRIHKSFQRTRWINGEVYTWYGIRKQVGRGEGRSGLAFDQLMPVGNAEKEEG